MTLYAVLSDIHANYVALEAVEADARKFADRHGYGNPRFICLGDVVDYGPQPNECMRWVNRNASKRVVLGNHDQCAVAPRNQPPRLIDDKYWAMTIWTRLTLEQKHKEWIRKWTPESFQPYGLKNFALVHASLEEPRNTHRIEGNADAKRNYPLFGGYRYVLFGHTHFQGYYQLDENNRRKAGYAVHQEPGKKPRHWEAVLVDRWRPLPRKGKMMLNPGSVGQSRFPKVGKLVGNLRKDNRAAYMLLDVNGNGPGQYRFRRVRYDVDETVRLLRDEVTLIKDDQLRHEHHIYWGETPEPEDFDTDAKEFRRILDPENYEDELEKTKKILIRVLRQY